MLVIAFSGCSVESIDSNEEILSADGNVKIQKTTSTDLEIPAMTIGEETTATSLEIVIKAGATGAPGGLSVRWMTDEDYQLYGWNNDEGCHEQLNSKKNGGEIYNLAANDEFHFFLEDYISGEGDSCDRALDCGMKYWFKVQAAQDGQNSKSGYSEAIPFSTANCEICPFGKGYWRNHSNDNPGDQIDAWLDTAYETGMSLGSITYSRSELNDILDMNNSLANSLVNFSQHLIAAKMNVAIGVTMDGIGEAIEAADNLINNKRIGTDGFTQTEKEESSSIKAIITEFNGVCGEDE